METVHDGADSWPSPPFSKINLGEPNQEQGEPTEENMTLDLLLLAVIDRTKLKGGLQTAKGCLDLQELLVSKGDLVGREAGVIGADEILAVELLVCPDTGLVDGKTPVCSDLEIPLEEGMGSEGTNRLVSSHLVELSKGLDFFLKSFDSLLAAFEPDEVQNSRNAITDH